MKKKTIKRKSKTSPEIQYRYDEQQGIFVRESEVSVNWLLNQVLVAEGLQITKVSNEQIELFLELINKSNLRMVNGQHALFWLKEKLEEKRMMADSKDGEVWHNITDRYRFILEQIDMILISSDDIKDKIKMYDVEKPKEKDPNNMILKFKKDTK
ncbi:MAG TPA: hypothetical protein VMZ91_06925 [Candidatus Paceibacterota bacterium]|nr:hypothetical protein [Candidatus Paceibacterota bacterium]